MARLTRQALALTVTLSVLLAGCLGGSDASDSSVTPSGDPGAAGGADGADAPPGDGNAAGGDAATNDTTPPDATPPPAVVSVTNGTLTALAFGLEAGALGTACCIGLVHDGENAEGTFTPGENVTGIVVELAWDDATADLDLALRAPDYESVFPPELNGTGFRGTRGHAWWNYEGQAGAPDGPVKLVVTDEDALAIAGEWKWEVRGKYAQDTPFTVYLTLFHGPVPGDAYSAMGA